MKTEFHYVFQLTKKIVFEVSYYTLGSNNHPYFATSAGKFNQPKTDYCHCGQAQDALLTGKAREFWLKWDEHHCHDITQELYDQLISDIEELKVRYNYLEKRSETFKGTMNGGSFTFSQIREFSKQKPKVA